MGSEIAGQDQSKSLTKIVIHPGFSTFYCLIFTSYKEKKLWFPKIKAQLTESSGHDFRRF